MIELSQISKIYQVGGQEVRALDEASLSISQGEFVSIVGPSGSGKTTMMNIIGCLDVADSGQYILDGLSIDQYSDRQLARIRNNKIGFVFQGFNLLSRLTAEANVELPLIYQRMSMGERKERVAEALHRVELYDRRKHKPLELSGGQQQRVAIARALVTNPSLLLADEPTGNLDSRTGAEIIELFRQLHRSGNTILLITHNPDVAKIADRMVHIFDGKVYEEEPA
ncbi:MAG: ABC transporter ATP-binding protein [Saccharofermentanales bacterium]